MTTSKEVLETIKESFELFVVNAEGKTKKSQKQSRSNAQGLKKLLSQYKSLHLAEEKALKNS